LSTSAFRKARW